MPTRQSSSSGLLYDCIMQEYPILKIEDMTTRRRNPQRASMHQTSAAGLINQEDEVPTQSEDIRVEVDLLCPECKQVTPPAKCHAEP